MQVQRAQIHQTIQPVFHQKWVKLTAGVVGGRYVTGTGLRVVWGGIYFGW